MQWQKKVVGWFSTLGEKSISGDLALKLSPFDPNGVAKEGRPTGVVSAFAVQKLLRRGAVEQHLYLNFFTFVPGPDGIIA
jgi:hypothetical protein